MWKLFFLHNSSKKFSLLNSTALFQSGKENENEKVNMLFPSLIYASLLFKLSLRIINHSSCFVQSQKKRNPWLLPTRLPYKSSLSFLRLEGKVLGKFSGLVFFVRAVPIKFNVSFFPIDSISNTKERRITASHWFVQSTNEVIFFLHIHNEERFD